MLQFITWPVAAVLITLIIIVGLIIASVLMSVSEEPEVRGPNLSRIWDLVIPGIRQQVDEATKLYGAQMQSFLRTELKREFMKLLRDHEEMFHSKES